MEVVSIVGDSGAFGFWFYARVFWLGYPLGYPVLFGKACCASQAGREQQIPFGNDRKKGKGKSKGKGNGGNRGKGKDKDRGGDGPGVPGHLGLAIPGS